MCALKILPKQLRLCAKAIAESEEPQSGESVGTIHQGAKNAVEACMRVKDGEHVLIVTDKDSYVVGNALKDAARNVTSYVEMYVLEDYGTRPLMSFPDEIKEAIPKANVTFLATQAMEGELETLRMPFVRTALKNARHGHMPGVTARCMEEGMCSDYKRIVEFTQRLCEIVRNAKRIDVANRSGTKLRVELNPEWRWIKDDGVYHNKGDWGNLPQGELFTAAVESNGQIVIDELGDWFDRKYGCLTKPENDTDTPVYLNLEGSRVDLKTLECSNARLKRELIDYLKTDENSNRAGEFALPTNLELIAKPLIGNMLQDEKARVHHAFGDPVGQLTGAHWQSRTHVDGLVKKCDVWVDGRKIMEADKYLIF